jgi:hypothetical protein
MTIGAYLRGGLLVLTIASCRGAGGDRSDSTHGSLPPVYPSSPLGNTNWDLDAGPVLIMSGGGSDSVAVVIPEATDSTIASFQGMAPPTAGLTFDLFSRNGKAASAATLSVLPGAHTRSECYSWPMARLRQPRSDWRVGFQSGRVSAIELDSIESRSSVDSADLAAALTRAAATLPAAADPTFRGLPFRVRSAYTFRLHSIDVVIADVVRTVNEEASPKVEHIFIIGERNPGTDTNYETRYYSRTAGTEESTQATDVLAVIQLGSLRRPAIVVSLEYDDGRKIGLIERKESGQWSSVWRSAYTDC